MMLKLLPLLLMVGYGVLAWQLSAARTRALLNRRSVPLADAGIGAVTARLARALDLPHIPVHVFEVAAVNGLAAPDGRIFLTRGFIDRYRQGGVTAEELGGVIAHELGHVALGHSRRRMIDFTGQNAVRVVLATLLGRLVPGLGIWIANLLVALVAARLSRRDEFEADAYAAALLTRAGIGTGPQVSLLAKLDALTGRHGGGAAPAPARAQPAAWLMSHPPVPDRIAAVNALAARWQAADPPR